jgi:glycosyltransferase involved in cell wall biosynthesis
LKKVIISVTSDLVTDQRVHKVAQTLHEAGCSVILFGRRKKKSQDLEKRDYKTKRTRLFFEKGFLFYINYNIRLFFYLFHKPADILIANDLDTLLPNFIISKIFNKKLVYDSHEYFTGVPELSNRPLVRNFWKLLEDNLVPKLNYFYTASDSFSQLYAKEFEMIVKTIHNYPLNDYKRFIPTDDFGALPAKHSETAVLLNFIYENLKLEKRGIILYQGAINKDRGVEEMIDAMEFVENACFLIIGTGDIYHSIRKKVEKLTFKDKILLIGQIPFQYLSTFTELADLGLSIEKPSNLNYIHASPNKVFDYLHAGVPVLGSNTVEISRIIENYNVGSIIKSHEPYYLAEKINRILLDKHLLKTWKKNAIKAAKELSWETEKNKLLEIVL